MMGWGYRIRNWSTRTGGIRVRLRHAHSGGLSALVWLPEAVAETATIPPAAALPPESEPADGTAAPHPRLPIYDSVESDWFRRGGSSFSAGDRSGDSSWTSPGDEGFRAAEAVASPSVGETTAAGLPKRVPSANLVPGSVGGRPPGQQPAQAENRQPRGAPVSTLAAVTSGLASLTQGAARTFQGGMVVQTVVKMQAGVLG